MWLTHASTAPGDIHYRQSQFSNARLPGQPEWLQIVVHGCHGRISVSPLVGKTPGPAGFGLSGNSEHLLHICTLHGIRRDYDVLWSLLCRGLQLDVCCRDNSGFYMSFRGSIESVATTCQQTIISSALQRRQWNNCFLCLKQVSDSLTRRRRGPCPCISGLRPVQHLLGVFKWRRQIKSENNARSERAIAVPLQGSFEIVVLASLSLQQRIKITHPR